MPIEQNTVDYFVLPTLHPAFVARKIEDKGPHSPFRQFVGDLQHALRVYQRFREKVFGIEPLVYDQMPEDFTLNADVLDNVDPENQE